MSINAITLFCESVRPEANMQNTLVGVLPDNLNLDFKSTVMPDGKRLTPPPVLPKLSSYTRLNFKIHNAPSIEAKINVIYNSKIVTVIPIDPKMVEQAIEAAKAIGSDIAGLIIGMEMQGLAVENGGALLFEINDGDIKIVSGRLNISIANQNS